MENSNDIWIMGSSEVRIEDYVFDHDKIAVRKNTKESVLTSIKPTFTGAVADWNP
jgi:hypothetical protein